MISDELIYKIYQDYPNDVIAFGREVAKASINLQSPAAEPAPLVKLTDDSLISIYLTCKAEWKATNKRERERIAVLFGHAIMDAMIAKNGGV